MDLKEIAIKMVMEKFGGSCASNASRSALDELTAGNGSFDIADLVRKFTGAGGAIEKKSESWLGDGANDAISMAEIKDVIGSDGIDAFAVKMGMSAGEASGGLAELLPQLIDKSSRGGNLLDSVGGASGPAGMASKFLR